MIIETDKFKYFLYARKSTENEDKQIQSIDDQVNRLREHAIKNDIKVVKEFKEARSAKEPCNRPVFEEMIKGIENGYADAVLCWQIDRMSRNPIDSGRIQYLLQKRKIKCIQTINKLWLPDDNTILLSVETGQANEQILKLSRDVKRGMQSKREKGQFQHKARMGYINKDKGILPDPDRFDILQRIWKMFLTGNYSVAKLIDNANEYRFKTRKTKRNGGKKLTKARLYEMFSNPFYKSEYIFNGKTYKLNHMPMVTAEEFDITQDILGGKNKPRRKSHDFSYRGPLTCGECGCLITAEEKIKKIKSTGKSISYIYYHCTGRKGNCSQTKCIREDRLVELIKDEISRFVILPQFRDWALTVLRESHADEVSERKILFKNLEKSYKAAESKINNLIDMRASDEITKDEFDIKKEEYTSEKARIKENIDNYDHRVDHWFELTEKAFDFISCAREAFETGDLSTKKAILTALGKKIILLDGKIHIEPEDWLVPIADRYPALKKEYEMFEPAKSTDFTHKNEVLAPIRTAWLLQVVKFRTIF